MKKRLHSTMTILHFALLALLSVWQVPKHEVSWEREFKTITFSIRFYNHLFDEEIPA